MDQTAFPRMVLEALNAGGVPALVGGSHALVFHTGVSRPRRDLDLMIRRRHWPAAEEALRSANIESHIAFPHWIAKATGGNSVVDLLFNSGNGLAVVDDEWFLYARRSQLFDVDVLVVPREELLWSKAFVMERERFDGGDVQHLLATGAGRLDWPRVLRRFTGHEPVLLAHMVLFNYIYPGYGSSLPSWLMPEIQRRVQSAEKSDCAQVCRGTLLSRAQYLSDVGTGGLADARRPPYGTLTEQELDCWTRAIDREDPERTAVYPVSGFERHH